MDVASDLWHSNDIKVILHKFVKDHCFWTLWALNYVDCIPFSCNDSFHIAHNQAKQFKAQRQIWDVLQGVSYLGV